MGLWNQASLSKITQVFPLDLIEIRVEPLDNEGSFCPTYLGHIERTQPALHLLLSRLPWRATKLLLSVIKRWAEGRNLLAVYTKRPA